MEPRVPSGERSGVEETLKNPPFAVEELPLDAGQAERGDGGDVVRRHPFEHLVLDDQAAAPASQDRRRLLFAAGSGVRSKSRFWS